MSLLGNPITSVAFLTDQFSGNGSTTVFTMSVAPANTASILVAVSGVVQDPSTYSVIGTSLTFSAAPPSGTGNVSVRYLGIPASGVTTTAYRTITEFTATAGQTTFTVPSYTVGYINVYDNGVRQGAADFTATNGTTVVLATAALAGDLITVESFYVSSVLNAIPAVAGAVNSTYIAPNVTLTAPTLTTPNIDSAQVPTVSGTAPLYMARAWVNFNGTGTVAIRASGNVTSITDNGTGDYTVNFTTAMPDANYGIASDMQSDYAIFSGAIAPRVKFISSQAAGNCRLICGYQGSSSGYTDSPIFCVSIFR